MTFEELIWSKVPMSKRTCYMFIDLFPNICLAKLSTKYFVKLHGAIFFWGKKTHTKNRVTPTGTPEPPIVPPSQPHMTSTFARRPPRRAIPWQNDHFEAQGTE